MASKLPLRIFRFYPCVYFRHNLFRHFSEIPLVKYPLLCRFNAIEKLYCEAVFVQQLLQLFAASSVRSDKSRTHKTLAGSCERIRYLRNQFFRNDRFVENKRDISR